jgi:hypothetical protein
MEKYEYGNISKYQIKTWFIHVSLNILSISVSVIFVLAFPSLLSNSHRKLIHLFLLSFIRLLSVQYVSDI